jgi:uncharacterized cupredoxin-like copper-binding protein
MRLLTLGLALALAGCAGTPASPPQPANVAAGDSVDWGAAERREIVLTDFDFTPARIELEAGKPYILHLVNRGSGSHNFDAPTFFASARSREPVPATGVEVAKGEAREVALVPDAAGTYPLECSHLLHADIFGMTGEIVVRPSSS